MTAALVLNDVSMTYHNGHHAIAEIDLEIDDGQIVAVIGGSGCGKSTLLRLIAGLEQPSTGTVTVANAAVTGPSEHVGVVFQEPRLMPWLNVGDNVAFGLGHLPKPESKRIAMAALERVGLSDFAGTLPRQLSGGMAQRTALARALVRSPEVLLLDEPFSALDALTRADLQQHLLDLWMLDRQTVFLVTHDIDEALLLADKIIVLAGSPGRIVDTITIDMNRPRSLTDHAIASTRSQALQTLTNHSWQ